MMTVDGGERNMAVLCLVLSLVAAVRCDNVKQTQNCMYLFNYVTCSLFKITSVEPFRRVALCL